MAAAFLVASALCSGAETALTALGDARARQLLDSGGRRAALLAIWVRHPERVLSSLLIGNTLANIGAGALAGRIASQAAGGGDTGTALAIATGVTTSVILFFGEIIPKTLAKRHPVKIALAAIPLVQAMYWALWPLSTGLVRLTGLVVGAFGGGHTPTPAVTSEEIEYLIEMGTREGVLDEVKEELLNSVLEFADRVVKEVMVPRTRMVAIDKDAPPEEILRIVTENPYSRMPVYEGSVDNVIGILLVRDIVRELREPPPAGRPRAVPLTRHLKPAFFVPEQMKISRLLKEMQKRKMHLAVVVDEFGGTSGIATLEDVIEEIVGEIQDEGDVEQAPVKALGVGVYLADAGIPLRELEEYLNAQEGEGDPREIRFPEEGDYETLGGFVTATAGRVPPVGALVTWDGLTFTVRAGDERRVARVEIARRPGVEPRGPGAAQEPRREAAR
ncbi:hemolysin family protein [Anaeromyxobacter paludicola]|nr:hemolysin family protein [Anaeromyxobacter paludicola]